MKQPERLSISRIAKANQGSEHVWLSDDDGTRGSGRLVLRVNPGRPARFYVRYVTRTGKRTLKPIGTYSKNAKDGCLTLAQARRRAREDLHRVQLVRTDAPTGDSHASFARPRPEHQGEPNSSENLNLAVSTTFVPTQAIDVKETSTSAAEAASAPHESSCGRTLEDLCNWYVKCLKAEGKSTYKNYASYVRCHVAPSAWGQKPAASLTAEDGTKLLRTIQEGGKNKTTARHVRAMLRAAYECAINAKRNPDVAEGGESFSITANPIASVGVPKRAARTEVLRNLSWREFAIFWLALFPQDAAPSLPTRFVRLDILLGGQRCLQLLRATTKSIDLDENTILIFDGKGKREKPRLHLLPLLPLARREVVELMSQAKALGSQYLFPNTSGTKALDATMISAFVRALSDRLVKADDRIHPFKYQDIRRTIETRLGSMDVHKDTRAHLQSHGLSGVQHTHYDMWDYMPQKREALFLLVQRLQEEATKLPSTLPKELVADLAQLPSQSSRRVFFDTEFTRFREGRLLSIGLITDDDSSLYVEVDDPERRSEASEFCRREVLNQFGLVQGTVVHCDEDAGVVVAKWLSAFDEPLSLCYDFPSDWTLLKHVLHAAEAWERLEGIVRPDNVSTKAYRQHCVDARDAFLKGHVRPGRHHALIDAMALREMWRAHELSSDA